MQLKLTHDSKNLSFYIPELDHEEDHFFVTEGIAAGLPSPTGSYTETRISLDKTLVRNKEATFYAKVRGQSMIDANLDDGDLLVVDKSIEPRDGKIAVCLIDGEFTVKRLKIEKEKVFLMPANEIFRPIEITTENNFQIWGVVTHVIKKL
ncbi:DNA polymerase V [Zhouia amylolytica]|uniref:Peptidase S24/S26A/S26B n=2 Tax=Zhouia amylolytica TaxID=376730 RepID=W2UKK6_9FLAO|nr:translesion error-prone DNA polymerase V autoproteolytic subunit [Zhouia amylolytica]ETN94533.1 peptidase S24/S26A/S26B [Zhouia amylolytica AD3]MCQ0111536.1 translesion error-prone DNA polymerase V autoproteolytic subunit [Zhouia amylolytica]SFS78802.1 DNA polymerase V [Zhouia amylolytica]